MAGPRRFVLKQHTLFSSKYGLRTAQSDQRNSHRRLIDKKLYCQGQEYDCPLAIVGPALWRNHRADFYESKMRANINIWGNFKKMTLQVALTCQNGGATSYLADFGRFAAVERCSIMTFCVWACRRAALRGEKHRRGGVYLGSVRARFGALKICEREGRASAPSTAASCLGYENNRRSQPLFLRRSVSASMAAMASSCRL